MSDRRRRQWIAADVDFYSSDFGMKLRGRFGLAGPVVFDAYLRACKTAHVEGQITYSTEANFLSQIGIPDVELPWPLDELWRFLGDRHMTARRRRHGLTTVVSRRWDDWQSRRSPPGNATPKETDTARETETEKDTDKGSFSSVLKSGVCDAGDDCVNGWDTRVDPAQACPVHGSFLYLIEGAESGRAS